MFSELDIRDAFRSLPPTKHGKLPPLILTSTGDGFITEESLVRHFEYLMTDASYRLSTVEAGRKLEVEPDIVLQLVESSPNLALLSEEKLTIIPKGIRDSIKQTLQELSATQLVDKTTFSRENDVSLASIDALLHFQEDSAALQNLKEVNDCLLSKSYERKLSNVMIERISRSLQDVESTELSPHSLPGNPPIWYIRQVLQQFLDSNDLASRFYTEDCADMIRCVPVESVLQRRDAVISQVQSGEVSFLDLRTLSEDFRELFPSCKEARDYLETLSSIILFGDIAISEKWLGRISDKAVCALDDKGYADCSAEIETELAQPVQADIVEKVVQHVDATHTPDSTRRIGNYVFTAKQYASLRDSLADSAKSQAISQWHATKENHDKDIKFQILEIDATIAPDQAALRVVAQDKGLESFLSDHFWAEVANLESQNEVELSTFWIERVLSRVNNYSEGLKAIEDTKLHDQLADLLSTYLQKELLPETVSKARSHGLLCSRKSQKNLQKLETALHAGKIDLDGTLSAIEKFGKKQGIQAPESATLLEARQVLINDMVRRMQKPKTDGPLSFLLLVIVLSAKFFPGVVYATGKYAPKLLKQLKSKLSTEEYDRVEGWKELAKAGTVTADDKEAMRQMVEE